MAGVVRKHGPNCPGSSLNPVNGSSRAVAIQTTNMVMVEDKQPTFASDSIPLIPPDNLSRPIQLGPTLKKIPKSARSQCATLLTKLIQDVVADPCNVLKWSLLLKFGNSILSIPKRGGARHNLSNTFKTRVILFPENINVDSNNMTSHERKISDTSKWLAASVSSKIEDGNFKAAVQMLCSEDKPARVNDETVVALRLKHPPPPMDRKKVTDPNTDDFQPLVVSEMEVRSAIQSFPTGSAEGPDGLRPQHLKDHILFDQNQQLLHVLTDLVNTLLAGKLSKMLGKLFLEEN